MVGGNTSVNVPVETKETEAIMLLSNLNHDMHAIIYEKFIIIFDFKNSLIIH